MNKEAIKVAAEGIAAKLAKAGEEKARADVKPVIVLARSWKEFVFWCREQRIDPNRGPYRYVNHPGPVFGCPYGTKVIALGGWAENSLYTREMLSMLMARYDLSGVENLPCEEAGE